MREFGGDPAAVGKTIRLNGLPFTIAGVAEQRFAYLTPGRTRDLSIPMSQRRFLRRPWSPADEDAGSWWIMTAARLKPGVSAQAAQSQVSALFANELTHGDKPMAKPEDAPAVSLLPAQTAFLSGIRRQMSTMLYVLMLAAAIVLAIGCANVAGLQLARAGARWREIGIRRLVRLAAGCCANCSLRTSPWRWRAGRWEFCWPCGVPAPYWRSSTKTADSRRGFRPTSIYACWRSLSAPRC
jgi:hypothetical protein